MSKQRKPVETEVRASGFVYNGGFMHGTPCGRDKSFDKLDKDGYLILAVTH